ncbi:ThuA domain-containing protein [Paenibacillus thalictri]|uniref:Trehalose utilization protein ThuA n=1 Tax=Paenibacillus thalictri TaxID=2527873 RepID=A0A4Q9DQU8_9BACL|nr:ThuA domain-containing protein [Paenibacillus thalictri]TBL75783.1 trehalose utilization protein ThuA [Paenibacillus thalictri]
MIRVTVWNEFFHEKNNAKVAEIYPDGIHTAIAAGIAQPGLEIRTATQDMPEHGLTEEVLNNTDVLIWWGHKTHRLVEDAIVERVHASVLQGMGLIVLHSGHFSKIFKKLMGTTCDLRWREADEKERIWIVNPAHPIAEGLGHYIELEREEMYGEFFDIPAPDELIMTSWFEGGEVFRSGCTFTRGQGKIFYFRPGHEMYPTYYNKDVLKVISNGVKWAAPVQTEKPVFGKSQPLETIQAKAE